MLPALVPADALRPVLAAKEADPVLLQAVPRNDLLPLPALVEESAAFVFRSIPVRAVIDVKAAF